VYDGWIDDDGLGLREVEDHLKEAKRIAYMHLPRPQSEETSLAADSFGSPLDRLVAVDAADGIGGVAREV
jgi:hypothetical protein